LLAFDIFDACQVYNNLPCGAVVAYRTTHLPLFTNHSYKGSTAISSPTILLIAHDAARTAASRLAEEDVSFADGAFVLLAEDAEVFEGGDGGVRISGLRAHDLVLRFILFYHYLFCFLRLLYFDFLLGLLLDLLHLSRLHYAVE